MKTNINEDWFFIRITSNTLNHLEMIINDGNFKNIDKSTKMQKQTEDERYVLF